MSTGGRKDSVAFIENTKIDPFSQIEAEYDEDNDRFVQKNANNIILIQETSDITKAKNAFLAQVAKYEQKVGFTGVDLDKGTFSWDDVVAKMKSASVEYEGKAQTGVAGAIRKCFRKSSALRDPVESWLRCLPSESLYGSLLCGGLKIVVEAAGKINDVRKGIFAVLEQVPITVSRVETLRRTYPPDVLAEHTEQLIVALFDIYRYILVWLTEHPGAKAAKAVFNSKGYERELESKRAILEKLEGRIDKAADTALHVRVGKISYEVAVEAGEARLFRKGMVIHGAEVLNKLNTMLTDQQSLAAVVQELITRQALRADKDEARARLRANRDEAKARLRVERAKAELFELLEYDEDLSTTDLLVCLQMGEDITLPAKDRTAWILQSTAVHNWMFSERSRALIINSEEPSGPDRHSTVSFFSAMLVHGLQLSETAVVLYWFCGQHVSSEPSEMIGHMLSQLLHQGLEDVDASLLEAFRGGLKAKPLTKLLIDCIKAQLQETQVFVMVDSISFYEDQVRCDDIMYLFNRLVRLAKDREQEYLFQLKVLATSPGRSTYLGNDMFDDTRPRVLKVPELVDGANSGINRMALARGLSDRLIQQNA